MKRRKRWFGVGLFLVLIANACSKSEDDRASNRKELVDETVRVLCTPEFGRCCQAAEQTFDRDGCRAFAENYWDWPGMKLDFDAAERCLGALALIPQTCDDSLSDACLDMWQPNRKLGEACIESYECMPDENGVPATCGGDSICSTHERALYPIGHEGDPCELTCSQVACSERPESISGAACYTSNGLYCSPSTGACQRTPQIGEPCESECEGTLCRLGTCIVPLATGEECDGSRDVCEEGLCINRRCDRDGYFFAACNYLSF